MLRRSPESVCYVIRPLAHKRGDFFERLTVAYGERTRDESVTACTCIRSTLERRHRAVL